MLPLLCVLCACCICIAGAPCCCLLCVSCCCPLFAAGWPALPAASRCSSRALVPSFVRAAALLVAVLCAAAGLCLCATLLAAAVPPLRPLSPAVVRAPLGSACSAARVAARFLSRSPPSLSTPAIVACSGCGASLPSLCWRCAASPPAVARPRAASLPSCPAAARVPPPFPPPSPPLFAVAARGSAARLRPLACAATMCARLLAAPSPARPSRCSARP